MCTELVRFAHGGRYGLRIATYHGNVRGMKSLVHTITNELTDAALMARLNVTKRTVREARAKRAFPAYWYPIVRDMCEEKGIECPEEAFSFKSPSSDASLSKAS